MNIENKRILLTGASGGIGSVLCKLLAEQGVQLILTCFNVALLNQLSSSLGGQHISVPADISSAEGRADIIKACKTAGGVDGVINLAGILDFNLVEYQSSEMIEATILINQIAPILLCRELIPMLKEKAEGSILNVGSIFGSIGHPGFAVYCSSKAGMKSFTEALARELDDTNIRASYIAPRATSTSLNSSKVDELNKILGNKSDTPEYVAQEIVNLLKSGQPLRYLGWPEKILVRLNALFPGIIHGALVKKLNVIKKYAS